MHRRRSRTLGTLSPGASSSATKEPSSGWGSSETSRPVNVPWPVFSTTIRHLIVSPTGKVGYFVDGVRNAPFAIGVLHLLLLLRRVEVRDGSGSGGAHHELRVPIARLRPVDEPVAAFDVVGGDPWSDPLSGYEQPASPGRPRRSPLDRGTAPSRTLRPAVTTRAYQPDRVDVERHVRPLIRSRTRHGTTRETVHLPGHSTMPA